MSNKIQETSLNPRDGFVNASSRYISSEIVYYGDQNKLTYKIYKKTPIALSSNDKFAIVPSGMEYRPDLVSKQFYGVVDFWWKILEANNISDIFDFKAGINIRLPSNTF